MHIRPSATKRTRLRKFVFRSCSAYRRHAAAHRWKSGEGNLFIIQRNNKARAVALSDITNCGGKESNLYLLTKVDCIIHTAGAAECAVIGYMMDGQAARAPISLGYSSIYLLIYLFLHPEGPSQTHRICQKCDSTHRRPSFGRHGNGSVLSMSGVNRYRFWCCCWRYNWWYSAGLLNRDISSSHVRTKREPSFLRLRNHLWNSYCTEMCCCVHFDTWRSLSDCLNPAAVGLNPSKISITMSAYCVLVLCPINKTISKSCVTWSSE